MIKQYGEPLKNKRVYLGIDQSYTGFAIAAINEEGYFITVFKPESSGIDRLKDLQSHLIDALVKYEIIDVAMEGYAFGSQMANMLGELGGMVKLTLRDFGIYPLIVPPTNLKKYVCGKGTGVPKSHILLYVYKKWGVEIPDDNAADAYSLARLVAGTHSLSYEKEVYTKLQDPKFRER
jgi:Holliday junction resolvasome RuvABC endonuclease subunit